MVKDVTKVPGQGFSNDGDVVLALGRLDTASLAGSELVLLETGSLRGRPNEPDYAEAKSVNTSCIQAIEEGLLTSAHDASEGGILVAIAESCIAGNKGVHLEDTRFENSAEALFGETSNVIVVTTNEKNIDRVLEIARDNQCEVTELGRVGGDALRYGSVSISVDELRTRWDQGMVRKLGIL